jgi:hypothetical protein
MLIHTGHTCVRACTYRPHYDDWVLQLCPVRPSVYAESVFHTARVRYGVTFRSIVCVIIFVYYVSTCLTIVGSTESFSLVDAMCLLYVWP